MRSLNATEAAARGRESSELCALNQEHTHATALASYVIPDADAAVVQQGQTKDHARQYIAENGVDLTLEQLMS